jgi:hypothetical protein
MVTLIVATAAALTATTSIASGIKFVIRVIKKKREERAEDAAKIQSMEKRIEELERQVLTDSK